MPNHSLKKWFNSALRAEKKSRFGDRSNFIWLENITNPKWTEPSYEKFVNEAYRQNVIVYRCINLITQSAASIEWMLCRYEKHHLKEIQHHPLLKLLNHPHPNYSKTDLFIELYSSLLISGNVYLLLESHKSAQNELYILRPDKVTILTDDKGQIRGYKYQDDAGETIYPVDLKQSKSPILHLKFYHPGDIFYGLSPLETAARSIDQHNQAAIWNQSLLQNSARPSGALIVENNSLGSHLTEEQFHRLKEQLINEYSSALNTGKPLLLEGGLKWQEMSLSNRDLDFIEAKNMAAREIALAFGVPPQLLGIPGDNTYSNLQEARLALWEETIFPLLDLIKKALSNFFAKHYHDDFFLDYDKDNISALADKREKLWQKLEAISFLTINEKREAIGYRSLTEQELKEVSNNDA